jgi:nucleoside-diphosphate-sugar epimerase
VDGARHVLDFASQCEKRGGVRLFHLSTVCAAPVQDGVALEEVAPERFPYRNLYEWSKREAERTVMQYCQEQRFPILILRPSIITGHSLTGKATRFNGYYGVLRALALLVRSLEANLGSDFDRNLRLRILANPHLGLNLVPVDFVVEAMWQLSQLAVRANREQEIFHLANDTTVPVADLFRVAADMLQVTGIELVAAQSFQHKPMSGLERLFHQRAQFQAPYLLDCPHFATTNFRKAIPVSRFSFPVIDAHVLRQTNHYYLDELEQQFQATAAPDHTIDRQGKRLACLHRPSHDRRAEKDKSNTGVDFKQAA